jgi:hypothetical protein
MSVSPQVTTRIDPRLFAELERIAAVRRVRRADVLRWVIEDGVRELVGVEVEADGARS